MRKQTLFVTLFFFIIAGLTSTAQAQFTIQDVLGQRTMNLPEDFKGQPTFDSDSEFILADFDEQNIFTSSSIIGYADGTNLVTTTVYGNLINPDRDLIGIDGFDFDLSGPFDREEFDLEMEWDIAQIDNYLPDYLDDMQNVEDELINSVSDELLDTSNEIGELPLYWNVGVDVHIEDQELRLYSFVLFNFDDYGMNFVDLDDHVQGNDPVTRVLFDAESTLISVPEPTSLGLLGISTLALLRRRS